MKGHDLALHLAADFLTRPDPERLDNFTKVTTSPSQCGSLGIASKPEHTWPGVWWLHGQQPLQPLGEGPQRMTNLKSDSRAWYLPSLTKNQEEITDTVIPLKTWSFSLNYRQKDLGLYWRFQDGELIAHRVSHDWPSGPYVWDKLTGGSKDQYHGVLASSSQAPDFQDQKPTWSPRSLSVYRAYCWRWSRARKWPCLSFIFFPVHRYIPGLISSHCRGGKALFFPSRSFCWPAN